MDARLLVARGVECESVALAHPAIAVRAEVRAGLREREVDVEEDGAKPVDTAATIALPAAAPPAALRDRPDTRTTHALPCASPGCGAAW